jgi:hypothetical protein
MTAVFNSTDVQMATPTKSQVGSVVIEPRYNELRRRNETTQTLQRYSLKLVNY